MAASATEMVVRLVFDGCLLLPDMEVERRPYHRNCGCALHNLKGRDSSYGYCSKQNKVIFHKKTSWSSAGCSSLLSMASPSASIANSLQPETHRILMGSKCWQAITKMGRIRGGRVPSFHLALFGFLSKLYERLGLGLDFEDSYLGFVFDRIFFLLFW
ncbi:hypothetical protein EZV62_012171 [Acer yangbiense]|uniref:Uncharacterized protein n=1 Tax=Acer yangbiense TaxID=1000413 RepID=A0A5C7HVJ5_9ROSI|nr:hypothetical protein EZV62_012171 [Acer yangbiense]